MHFKGFCLLWFDIQNITIKQSAGGCLFDVTLTVLKTLISQPSPSPPPLLCCWVGGAMAAPRVGERDCTVPLDPESWEHLGLSRGETPLTKCHLTLAGQDGNELGRKRAGKGVWVGAWSECPLLPKGLGCTGVCCLPAGHGDPRAVALGTELCPGAQPHWVQQEHPAGSACSVTDATERLPFPSWVWDVAQCGWRGSKPAPGTNGDDTPRAEGSPGASEGAGGATAVGTVVKEGVGEDGVTWLWGDVTLGKRSRLSSVCAGISSVLASQPGGYSPRALG